MTETDLSAATSRTRLIWSLLAVWLAYSAAVLSHALINDPLLATYVCMTR